ncbi:hypothetical protein HMPREF0574_0283 [Mobiluncus curtisii subsp. curtisii ATCC 35241]|uniref:Uncharacterized protein n=1 Tax=Mobiluncus curtisii (strain ATCC 43063 / DSM 2711 / V125) TaxID=548479 RepID=D6ZH38_MOBCV|nr:hypothetical protein HMPREF0573_11627 [Mobiluncus curtisii ATCC 43063]EFL94587.1 hypothetical protein HMPREF0574_0283 [Mobiluncus curtisii subsp. curtisii ATCC 35241]
MVLKTVKIHSDLTKTQRFCALSTNFGAKRSQMLAHTRSMKPLPL